MAALLDNPDALIRDDATRGMSSFVDNLPPFDIAKGPSFPFSIPQGPAPWKTTATDRYSLSHRTVDPALEPAYIEFWKNWWSTNKAAVLAGN